MMEKKKEFRNDHFCFVCGENNPAGLKLSPVGKGGKGTIRWIPGKEYQGYKEILHGGIISTLLDEAMAYAASSVAGDAATVEIKVKFNEPVMCGEEVVVEAEVVEHKKRLIKLKAVLTQGGEPKAAATATFMSGTE